MASGTTSSKIEYRSHGVPLEEYVLTRHDHRDQKTAVDIRRAVKEQAAKWEAEEAGDPGLRELRHQTVERGRSMLFSFASQTRDHELMRWRVRLYCGHMAEVRRHFTVDEPTRHGSSSMRCHECGMDPARIVAYEPIGPLAESPSLARPKSQRPRQSIEKRLAKIEAEAKELRDQLEQLDD